MTSIGGEKLPPSSCEAENRWTVRCQNPNLNPRPSALDERLVSEAPASSRAQIGGTDLLIDSVLERL